MSFLSPLRQFAVLGTFSVAALLSGCAERPAPIPSSALLMTEGNGPIVFRPTEFGRVYISDQSDDKILYQADIERGEIVELDSRKDQIRVAGRTVSDRPMDDGHNYRIFFEPMTKERVTKTRVIREEIRTEPRR